MNRVLWPALAGGLLIVAGLTWWIWDRPGDEPPAEVAAIEPPPPAEPEPAPPPEPVIRHPIELLPEEAEAIEPEAAEPRAPEAVDPNTRFVASVTGLLGRTAVLQWLQTDAFVERIVATVDNLPRNHAAAQRWPVVPAAGRFEVSYRDGAIWAAPGNERRYDELVRVLTAMDPARAAALYRRLYPQFQVAYEQLGFPNRYFNDRLVEVIDHLLAAPDAPMPLALTLTEVRGEIESATPWLRYQYADAELEARSAGQRILMRIGPGHQRNLGAWLREFRSHVAR